MEVKLIDHTNEPLEVLKNFTSVCTGSKGSEQAVKGALDKEHFSLLRCLYFTFEVKEISRVATHQLVRHKHLDFMQRAGRTIKDPDCVMPTGISGHCLTEGKFLEAIEESLRKYHELVGSGIDPNIARYVLPQGMKTEIIVTGNLQAYQDFFKVRLCSKSQYEIQELATKMLTRILDVLPFAFDYLGPNCDMLGYCPEGEYCKEGCTHPKSEQCSTLPNFPFKSGCKHHSKLRAEENKPKRVMVSKKETRDVLPPEFE